MDEAHGAHFGFSQGFPQKALAFGADLCIESVHKTLPAYTQSALLHYRKNPWIDLERVKQYLGIYQTSSPSYILMAGIDRCTRILREQGTELFAAYEQRLHDFYEKCRTLQRITVLSPDGKIRENGENDPGIWARDPSKILICAEGAGLHGQELAELLTEHYHLELEMASGHYATALTTLMDTQEGFDRLFAALQAIDRKNRKSGMLHQGQELETADLFTTDDIYCEAEKVLEIAEAMDAPKTTIPLMSAAGCVSGEFVYLYPPGIPILAPGERVTEEILETLRICQARNMQIEGMKDYSGQSLEICNIL